MDNENIAKKVLSLILEQEIISLQSKPQEIKLLDKTRMIPLSRFDFKAIVRTPENTHKNILIEVQKSRNPDPIMRFRRYLGKNYIEEETYINQKGEEVKGPLPIITIYFLGYSLPEYNNTALIVNNRIIDATTKEEIEKKNEFVELLTHLSYILQITKLPPQRRTKLERFLSFFDQSCKTDDDFVLDIEGDELQDLEDIANYLHKGTLDEDLLNSLAYEEDFDESVQKLEEQLTDLKQREAEERQQKQEAQQREAQALQEKKQAMLKLATKMKKYGESVEDIMRETGLTKNEIENLKMG
jgi:hypothetical protein